MNRKVSIAVGSAAAMAFAGVASAADILTINSTEGYVTVDAAAKFMPEWLLGECLAKANETSTAGCPDHGLALTEGMAGGFGEPNYWTGGDAIPAFSHTPEASWALVAPTGDNPFTAGLFLRNGTNYWTGLSFAWTSPDDAIANARIGMGAPTFETTEQEEWIDQTVVGYVESIRDSDNNGFADPGGDITLAQNFRSQFNMTGASITAPGHYIDQRLEQMVELNGITGMDFEQGRQTFQQAFSDTGGSPGTATASGGGLGGGLGQLVAQDIEGFFFSCFNCDSTVNGGGHAFTPANLEVRYQPYVSGWNVVPTIIHGGQ